MRIWPHAPRGLVCPSRTAAAGMSSSESSATMACDIKSSFSWCWLTRWSTEDVQRDESLQEEAAAATPGWRKLGDGFGERCTAAFDNGGVGVAAQHADATVAVEVGSTTGEAP